MRLRYMKRERTRTRDTGMAMAYRFAQNMERTRSVQDIDWKLRRMEGTYSFPARMELDRMLGARALYTQDLIPRSALDEMEALYDERRRCRPEGSLDNVGGGL